MQHLLGKKNGSKIIAFSNFSRSRSESVKRRQRSSRARSSSSGSSSSSSRQKRRSYSRQRSRRYNLINSKIMSICFFYKSLLQIPFFIYLVFPLKVSFPPAPFFIARSQVEINEVGQGSTATGSAIAVAFSKEPDGRENLPGKKKEPKIAVVEVVFAISLPITFTFQVKMTDYCFELNRSSHETNVSI